MFRPEKSAAGSPQPKTYAKSVLGLIGHLFGTAVIFTSFFAIGWTISVILQFLHAAHPFPAEIWDIVTRFELYLIYGDLVLCSSVMLVSAYRFLVEMMEIWK